MPTTRSKGRNEPLQRLETPPRRPRKPRPIPFIAQELQKAEPRFRTLSMSPEPEELPKHEIEITVPPAPVSRYRDAATQTEEVVVLTLVEAAELRERATASASHKRTRDEESEDEPVAKRHQFSTPQAKPNNLWMFGEKANGDHPRTAPSKPISGSSLRRPVRGPLLRRTNLADSPRFRVRTPARNDQIANIDSMKPIEQKIEKRDNDGRTSNSQAEDEAAQSRYSQAEEQERRMTHMTAPQTPRRGLFGSLRGMVHKGLDFAASLTPRGARIEPAVQADSMPEPGHIDYPQLQPHTEDLTPTEHASANDRHEQHDTAHRQPSAFDASQRSSHYDHLHYITADAESVDRAINGEISVPPRAPTPPSPASRIKAQNPQLSDATIESILRKRERKEAMDEQKYGPRPTPKEYKVAPLFGPDSHYARGTVDPRFLPPPPLYGPSKKRKLFSVDGEIPPPKNGGYGVDAEWLDQDNEVVSVDHPFPQFADPPVAKRQKTTNYQAPTVTADASGPSAVPATPRSALKRPGFSSVGRKSVAFGQSESRDVRAHYGAAGQYRGSTFADDSPLESSTLSTINSEDVISPNTRLNTGTNSGRKPPSILDNIGADVPAIDFTLRDPTDRGWRPSLGNPRPGVFRVPDIDEEDPNDESMSDIPPEQPQTPRLSHAELPGTAGTVGSASFNESSIVHESTELALDKARSKAEKYKPKSSSRLSEVSRARSRSTSPDPEDEDMASTPVGTATRKNGTSAVQPIGVPPQPHIPRELDDTIKGTDGMTDFEREHQFDSWAANLEWDSPQTYEDAGTGSAFIHNLIRKNWTDEDSQRSELFWAREFDEVDRAMEDAKSKGQRLSLITGMEGIEGY